jgi:mannitol/fructose-specific phosphotransferase system IIA component (Ntr-type)
VRLSELIQRDVIKIGLEAVDKWEAIEELVDLLISAHELRMSDRSAVVEAVTARERSLSTGLRHGLAVPHGSVDCVRDVIAAVGTSPKGIPFESLDDGPARLVILVVIPKGEFPRHVGTLAGISGLATGPELCERVLAASTPDDILDAIHDFEVPVDAGEPARPTS